MPTARDSKSESAVAALQQTSRSLVNTLEAARQGKSADSVRGSEGEAAAAYFAAFNHMFATDEVSMAGRSRRPPLDPVNALLSFLYSMLCHDARSACEAGGLDAAVGFLHRDRPGRPSLALDLMEELRPFLVDRLVLSLINRRQVSLNGFRTTESGAVLMDEDTRKKVITAYQKRKQDEIAHLFLDEKTTVGLLVHLQARLLARHVRGELDEYPPFIWR